MDIFLPTIGGKTIGGKTIGGKTIGDCTTRSKTKKYYDIQSYKYIRRYAEELYKINTMCGKNRMKEDRRLQHYTTGDGELTDKFINKEIDMAINNKKYHILLRYKNDTAISCRINWIAMFNGDLVICKCYLTKLRYFGSCAKNPSIIQLSIVKYKTRLNQTTEITLNCYPLIKSYKSRDTFNLYLQNYYKHNN